MIYGLYLSATGVLTNSHRQDVIANNLANAETVGFKRSLALFQQRRTEAQALGKPHATDPTLDHIGGGLLLAPTYVDQSEGQFEQTGNNLDVAIHGRGFFAVQAGKQTMLTRNGQFMADRNGALILADGSGHKVLDFEGKPISLAEVRPSQVSIGPDGTMSTEAGIIGRIGMFDVADDKQLSYRGGTLIAAPELKNLKTAGGTLQSEFIERSNVDPTTELTQLINVHRQLEANANMIRYQDQALGKLVNEVGKIG